MESIAAQRLPYSKIRVMFDAARKLEREGRDIIHLEIGRPDFNTPGHIVEAAIKALREGKHHYSPNAGIIELRRAVAEKYARESKLRYDPETEVVITNGVAEGVFLAVNALLNPGDQILMPDPRWVNYEPDACTNFVEPIPYTLHEDAGFQPDPDEIAGLIGPRTRMIILASPSNPTGGVTGRDVLERIARLAVERDLIVVSDEIYEKIIYPPAEHVCAATLEGLFDRTLVLNGFSKFYSMTGWRQGWVTGPRALIDPILRYHQYMITSTCTFAQWGAIDALPGFSAPRPAGAFYLFPSVADTGLDGIQMSRRLLEQAGVATVAGEYFGRNGAGHIRISYASSMDNLKSAVERIGEVAAKL